MNFEDTISLTRKLISFDTINPPGNEAAVAEFLGNLLKCNGFKVRYVIFKNKRRLHLIAEKGIKANRAPIVLSGHFDTVPLGHRTWTVDPFKGIIKDDKIFGRGSSDMKSGLAALVSAAVNVSKKPDRSPGIRIIFTAGEEMGCQGVQQLIETCPDLGNASAIIIGEPTGNIPSIGHKGALFLNVITKGKTAHSSTPHLGDNAIYKAASRIAKIERFRFNVENDCLLGFPSINVGMIKGGMNINSVPDYTEFTIDIRTTTKTNSARILRMLKSRLGKETEIHEILDRAAVFTEASDPFVKIVLKSCGLDSQTEKGSISMPYLTDGSVLQPFYGNAPTIILGPGEQEMAHMTDEYCYLFQIEKAVSIYQNILIKWGESL